jgi:hypothetical protein
MIHRAANRGWRSPAKTSLSSNKLLRLGALALLITLGTTPVITLRAAQAALAARDEPGLAWQEPIIGLQARIVGDYQAPAYPWGSGHRGVDVLVEFGEVIVSPAAGSVHFAGWVVNRGVLSIVDERGRIASFEPVCSLVRLGSAVQAGDAIAVHCEPDPGYQRHCVGECVHFSARQSGAYLSPLHLIYGLKPSRLWPVPSS